MCHQNSQQVFSTPDDRPTFGTVVHFNVSTYTLRLYWKSLDCSPILSMHSEERKWMEEAEHDVYVIPLLHLKTSKKQNKNIQRLPFKTRNSTCWQEGETSLSLQRNWGTEKRNLKAKDKQWTCFSFADAFIVIATLFWTLGYILPPLNALQKVIFLLCVIFFPRFVIAFVAKKRMNEAHFARAVP